MAKSKSASAKESLRGTVNFIKFAKEEGPRAFRICVVDVEEASFPWSEMEITVKGPLGDIKNTKCTNLPVGWSTMPIMAGNSRLRDVRLPYRSQKMS